MVKIAAQGQIIECDQGDNLRQVLLAHGVEVYNGNAKMINCRGIGTCGTCAVAIEGDVSAQQWRETARLALPPHTPKSGRRLACQVQVLGDVKITKYDGFWGQGKNPVWSSAKTKIE